MVMISGKYKAYPYIRDKKEFITQSKNFSASLDSNDSYKIYSYRTVIAQFYDGVWYINDGKYSIETSKHQQEIRYALGHKFLEDNAMHTDYAIWGLNDLRSFVTKPAALMRVARIRREQAKPMVRTNRPIWDTNDKYTYV
jgi:hypothetical protein